VVTILVILLEGFRLFVENPVEDAGDLIEGVRHLEELLE
jgi:hypothetical protein